jgi:hypothetical protein
MRNFPRFVRLDPRHLVVLQLISHPVVWEASVRPLKAPGVIHQPVHSTQAPCLRAIHHRPVTRQLPLACPSQVLVTSPPRRSHRKAPISSRLRLLILRHLQPMVKLRPLLRRTRLPHLDFLLPHQTTVLRLQISVLLLLPSVPVLQPIVQPARLLEAPDSSLLHLQLRRSILQHHRDGLQQVPRSILPHRPIFMGPQPHLRAAELLPVIVQRRRSTIQHPLVNRLEFIFRRFRKLACCITTFKIHKHCGINIF